MRCYKIVEIRGREVCTLFHGMGGSKVLELGIWIKSEERVVRDGSNGKEYISGFHVFLDRNDAREYFTKRFRIQENRIIIECECKEIRKKREKGEVYLAKMLMVPETEYMRMYLGEWESDDIDGTTMLLMADKIKEAEWKR